MGTLAGRQLAHLAWGRDPEAAFLPVTPLRPIRGLRFARPALELYMRYLRWRDRIELARAGRH